MAVLVEKRKSDFWRGVAEYAAILGSCLGMRLSCRIQKHVGMVQMITFLFLIPKNSDFHFDGRSP